MERISAATVAVLENRDSDVDSGPQIEELAAVVVVAAADVATPGDIVALLGNYSR